MQNNPLLATHPHPHLDDVCALWLLVRFVPAYKDAKYKFIPQGAKISDSIVAVGIGKGEFDEHKGDIRECATSLVFKKIQHSISNPIEHAALSEIVAWVNTEDHAGFMDVVGHEYSVALTVMSLSHTIGMTSQKTLAWGMHAMDGILETVRQKHALMHDWTSKQVIETKWGKGVALETDVGSVQVGRRATQDGYVVFAVVNPKNNFRYIKSAIKNSHIDLSDAYMRAHTKEPRAEWYLHHSKKMLICGSDVARNKHLSNFSLAELIALVR